VSGIPRYAWLTLTVSVRLSVADQEDSVKRQRQSLTGVERRQEVKTAGEDRHRSQLAAVIESVAHGQEQDQVLGVEDQARPDDVAVRRIAMLLC
jgi:heme exporter protein D